MPKKHPQKLPKNLHRFFWEIDPNKFDPFESKAYTINRLLDKGNLEAVKWLLNNFPQKTIKKTIKTRRDWNKKSVVFWANYFNLKNEDVVCLKKSFQKRQKTFWPY